MSSIGFDVDPVHTHLGFAVRYLAISRVHGRFTRFGGVLEIDWEELTRSRAHLRIDAASIDTGHPERDAHLRSPDFLDVERFPEIVFHSGELRRRSGAVFEVSGTLEIHGIVQHATLEAEYGGQVSDLNGFERAGLLARGVVDRRLFGLTWNRPLETGAVLVGWNVELDLSIQGIRPG
jgi:polyisoprenoid-binding protein YceI